jgi:hypothetical protein
MSFLPTNRSFSRTLEAVEELGSYCSAASANSSLDDCPTPPKDASPACRKHKRVVSRSSLPPSPCGDSISLSPPSFNYISDKTPLASGRTNKIDDCVECASPKQLFFEVTLLDEQLLPDNGLLLRTWSSLVSW